MELVDSVRCIRGVAASDQDAARYDILRPPDIIVCPPCGMVRQQLLTLGHDIAKLRPPLGPGAQSRNPRYIREKEQRARSVLKLAELLNSARLPIKVQEQLLEDFLRQVTHFLTAFLSAWPESITSNENKRTELRSKLFDVASSEPFGVRFVLPFLQR